MERRQNDEGGGLSDPWRAAGGERGRYRARPPNAHEEIASRPRGVDVSCGSRERSQGRAFAPPSLNFLYPRHLAAPVRRGIPVSTSVLDCYALDVVFLEIFAGGFRRILVEPGEAGAIKGGAPLIDRFGEGFGTRQYFRCLALNGREALLGGLLGGVGADLNHPAGPVLRLCRRWSGFRCRCRRTCWRCRGPGYRNGNG